MIAGSRSSPVRWQCRLSDDTRVGVLARANAINLIVNNEQPSYTFDPAGRLHGAFVGRRNYRRSLDNRVLCKWAERESGERRRRRRWLDRAEARRLVDSAYRLAEAAALAARREDTPEAIRDALERVGRWNWEALEVDRRRFQEIYTPVGILPPDQYLALVLQATQGCSHNACTFCTFYREQPFRIKSPAEFREHVAVVLGFFGPALAMRRSIFLADANALVIPMPRLLALLDVLDEQCQLPGCQVSGAQVSSLADDRARPLPPDTLTPDTLTPDTLTPDTLTLDTPSSAPSIGNLPLFAFIDAFHVHRKSVADWRELCERGLRRVYIGMESGHDPLLRWLNKPGTAQDVLDAVVTLKAAGLNASVIIMIGVGGDRFAAGHVADTAALLSAMPLAAGDLVYFSAFVEQPDAPYGRLAAEAGIRPLTVVERRAQEAMLRQRIVVRDPQDAPQFSRYTIDEFLY